MYHRLLVFGNPDLVHVQNPQFYEAAALQCRKRLIGSAEL